MVHVGRIRRASVLLVGTLAAALLGACTSYSPAQLSAMSAVDLCELQHMQGPNLSREAKQTIAGELQRRNDNCRNHAVEVSKRYEAFIARETYGKHDDP